MKTSDVYLAAACLALGYKLEIVDRTDPRHMKFEFAEKDTPLSTLHINGVTSGLEYIENQWANRSLVVNGWDFAEAIKRMKSIIHSS